MRLTRSAILALSLLAPVLLSGAQAPPQQPKGTGVVVGQVIDGVTGRPIAEVAVIPTVTTRDMPYGRPLAPTATDADGHFVLRGLPDGNLTIGARRLGFIDGWYGAADAMGAARPVVLGSAGKLSGLTIRMWPNAAIGGTVLDDRGEPIADLNVQALKRTLVAGHWRLGEYFAFQHQTRTDDRGEFRITDLTPGDYAVVIVNTVATSSAAAVASLEKLRDANPSSPQYLAASAPFNAVGAPAFAPGARTMPVGDQLVTVDNPALIRSAGDSMPLAFPTQFYPGVQDASAAQLITVSAGQERLGIDFAMRPVKAVRVSGIVYGPSGPASGIPLRLLRGSGDALQGQFDSVATVSGSGGTFTFLGVTAGDYTLKALDLPRPPPVTTQVGGTMVMETATTATAQPTLWANANVNVGDADVKDVSVNLQTGARFSGTIAAEGTPAGAPPRISNVDIEPADGRLLAARTNLQPIRSSNGTFTSQQLPPGRYLIRSGNYSTVTLQGRDITEIPVELGAKDVTDIAITTRLTPGTSLSGSVRPRASASLGKSSVLVFPANRERWMDYGKSSWSMTLGTSQSGAYSIISLPAGDYLVVATDEAPQSGWADPSYLAQLAALGTAVTLRANDPKTLDLTAIKLPAATSIKRAPIAEPDETLVTTWTHGPYVADDVDQQPVVRDNATQPVRGGGLLGGTVTDADAAPLRNAIVVLTCSDVRYSDTAITDATGQFAFRAVPSALCTVAATKAGFLSMRYGAKEPGKPGTAIAVNGPMRSIAIALQRAGVISGTIRDERGHPMSNVAVLALEWTTSGGERSLQQAGRSNNSSDNRGNYRIAGLTPGEYLIAVNRPNIGFYTTIKQTTPDDYKSALKDIETGQAAAASAPNSQDPQQEVGYTVTYYPGTPFLGDAAKVTVGSGEDRAGIDVNLSVLRLATITVRATGPDGQPPAGVLARLFREDSVPYLDLNLSMVLPFPRPGGTISLSGVPPGRFTVDVGGTSVAPGPLPEGGFGFSGSVGSTGLPMYAQTPVVVDGKDIQVDVTLSNAVAVTGKIVFENTGIAATTPAFAGTRAALYGPKQGGLELRTIFNPADAAGAIKFENIVPAPYRVQTTAPRGWMIKSATINGVDAADIPVDITSAGGEVVVTFTDRVTELSGKLQSSTGTPEPGYTVIAFAADKKYWRNLSRRIVTARPATDGRFVFTGIPPGEYRIAAVTDVKPGEWFDPAFLEQLVPASAPVTVADGEKKVQNLVIK